VTFIVAATGPSPSARGPWHEAQCVANVSAPDGIWTTGSGVHAASTQTPINAQKGNLTRASYRAEFKSHAARLSSAVMRSGEKKRWRPKSPAPEFRLWL
jgi:hypothetical protein